MKKNKVQKLLAVLLTASMIFGLTACGNGGSGTSNDTSNTDSSTNETAESAGDSESEGEAETETAESDAYVGPDWEAIDAMGYDEKSDALYDYNLGEFNEYYQVAKEEVTDLDKRMALMAVAEAKLLESGVFQPVQSNGGNYAISRVVPRTGSTVLWGLDEYKWYTYLVTNELLRTEDRTELVSIWGDSETADDWFTNAKAFLEEKGYTLSDTYNNEISYQLVTWDVIATSMTSDSYFISCTYSGLLEYDALNQQQPALAESYEVSDDGTTYTFHIRPGVKWVDQQGREVGEVTADDWVASMQHVADNDGELGYLMTTTDGCGIKNYDAWVNGEISDFSEVGVEAVDDYTLVYTLEAPFPAFASMMGYGCFAPLNRSFYKSQGGTFSAEGDEYTPGNYGTDPSHIAYCGPYLITNYTENNVTSYKANPAYWNADAVNTQNINIYYNDSSDPLRAYNDTKDNVASGCGLNSSALVQAQQDIPDGETETYFDLYGYTSATDGTTFCGWVNINRATWANYDDDTVGVSPQTDEDKLKTREALSNQNFRLALAMAFDRGAFNATSVGEDLKYVSLRNAYVPGTFQALANDTTIEINGESVTFKAGTYFGEVVQAQLNADEIPLTVWDPSADDGVGSGDGFDGWYNADNAVAFLDDAIAELAEVGVEISAENPVYIDIPWGSFAEYYSNRANAYKQSIENVLGGKVIVNLVEFNDQDSYTYSYYRISNGNEANFDAAPGTSGWGPDYGDAQTYLDTIQPYGYMCKNIGLY
ncbi:MAG: peptide ABC transporter substrate-binding protein [Lachnospiraceae bacterium]|nr:peptide ABC transporter substrate-binding protein [Lachnospiraceae bacterium]MBD5450188.1 peptide ABC transporter substrate-binding protein [Lachnospiraceae bacterium]